MTIPRIASLWVTVLALGSLSAAACYKSVDYDKVKCSADGSGCPSGYSCSLVPGKDYGTCVGGGVRRDSGGGDLSLPAGWDAKPDHADGAARPDARDGAAERSETGFDTPIGPTTGTACSSATDCGGGYCVDGVCCDSPCDGQCQSCKEPGSVGQCRPIAGSPVGDRAACGGTGVCKSQCDGIHGQACAYPDSTTICTPASCVDGKVSAASVCDSAGACSTPAVSACPGGQCADDGSAKCATACTAMSCGAGAYCDATGACFATRTNGAACSTGAQCASGFCVDGICCDGKCDGQCESCRETGSLGTCKAVTGAPLPTRTACGGSGSCKGQCDGTNGRACSFPGSSTVCTAGSCANGKATTASVCNSSGACTTPTVSQCPSNLCGTDGKCSGSCTETSCTTGTYCNSAGSCVTALALGAACSSGAQCASGLCVDGVCCNDECDGQCQSCKAAGSVGTCKTIQGDPVSPRAACGGTGKCKAQCNGTNATACTYPGSSTVCTPASCTAGKVTTASVCDAGSCTASTTSACDSNLCAADGISCAGSCTSTSCSPGTYCGSGGACTPKLDRGQPCSDNVQCTTGNCVDNVCCDSSCNGQCQSCAATAGTCRSVTTPRSPCGGSGLCAGYCDGTSPTCTLPGSSTTCAAARCQDSTTALAPVVCNGTGVCPAAVPSPCPAGQVCSGAGVCACPQGTCGTSCQTCASGQRCSGGSCVCDATSCSAGCCNGSTCVPVASQTTAMCGGGANGACKACVGQACVSGACSGSCSPSTSCNDSNECTTSDTCNSVGVCSGTPTTDYRTCSANLLGICQNGSCGCYQNVAPVACTSGSSCLSWGFESNSVDGWAKSPNDVAVTGVALDANFPHSGSRSLAASVGIGWFSPTATLASEMKVRVPVCPGSGTANISSYWFYAWVRVEVPLGSGSLPSWGNSVGVSLLNSSGSNVHSLSASYNGGWVQVVGQVPAGAGQIRYLEIYGQFPMNNPDAEGFMGKVLIDDVRVSVN